MESNLPIYSLHRDELKDEPNESFPFYLDLKNRRPLEFQKFPIFEFPCIPLIGVYGENYWPTALHCVIDIPFSDAINVPDKLKWCIREWKSEEIEFRFVIHEMPVFAECQKFSCSNFDEFNVMYHTWAFPNHQVDDEASKVEKLESGCFEPIGVQGVHLNLSDGGMAINEIKMDYTIVIHDLSFSPANLMLQVTHTHPLISFFSVAHLPNTSPSKKVIQLHLLSVTSEMEDLMKNAIHKSVSLGELVHHIDTIDPTKEVSAQIRKLFDSIPLS